MSLGKLAEAKRLYDLGAGIHWLRPRSKVPVKAKWTTGERDDYKTLKNEYQSGYNIGTKLGRPSKTSRGYLAVLDVDVKSTDPKHRREAEEWVKENFPDLLENSPITRSGRGNGSRHVWFVVKKPVESRALYSSPVMVEVLMPSAKPTEEQIKILGKKKIAEGWRLRAAFEIDFMCEGRQVVLPPSIHPDTGKEYRWSRPFESLKNLSVIDIESKFGELKTNKKTRVGRPKNATVNGQFEITDPEESDLEASLPPNIIAALYAGSNVSDRSAHCLSVSLAMVTAGFKDSDILGVLTNRDYYLGDVAYEHAKTSHRQRAARWAYDYCLTKARGQADALHVFSSEVEIYDTLSDKRARKQLERLAPKKSKEEKKEDDWRKLLDKTDKDFTKPTFKNVKLILENAVGENVFIRDDFANRDTYGKKTPWGGRKGELLTDDDSIKIKNWFNFSKWKIDPSVHVINDVIKQICNQNIYDPVKDYLESLEWDGVKRIDTWMKDYLGADMPEPYLSEVSRKFLIAAVARTYNPGVKFDNMVIFEGLQGIGKSTVGNILAGDKWFLDGLPDLHDKDAALNLQGQWIVEMGELTHMKKNEVEVVKSFVARRIDKVRPPYGHRMVELQRRSIFFGSTNADTYLRDKTGNRRFWPVEVHDVDFKALREDRDQLWAEALFYYDNVGEVLYLQDEVRDQAESIQESRVVEDVSDIFLQKISNWKKSLLAKRKKNKAIGEETKPLRFKTYELFGDENFSNVDLGAIPLVGYKPDNYNLQLVAFALKKNGFRKIAIHGRNFWKLE